MIDPPDRELTVFSAARLLPTGERAAFLDEACAGDAALRQRVEELLQAGDEAGAFLNYPAPGTPRAGEEVASLNPNQAMRTTAAPAEKAGDRIGRYKLLQQIGEGGCGVVYMAEQEEPVRRLVALKVIKLGMDTKSVVARFEAERQALALMDHPNIAKVLDAGATDTGRPFFVMELVRGIKITDYCDKGNLPTRERLNLFVQVCQAIQHAHQKGVIHRDIKPSNILVTLRDGVPVPKVIDFGIAKATTDQRLTDKTLFTAFEQFIGTPAYMSPEQAEMSELGIDTRSDIYSLGVLLYELLTGQTPFDARELLQAGLEAMRRTIREKEPARPSTRLSTLVKGELTAVAHHRQTDALKLVNLLRGDLDWIVIKSLEKDRARRYETANGLAMDVQRYLDDEPVVARPPSNLYQFQKMVRRNRLAFAAATVVSTVLVIGLGVATWMFFKEQQARQQAEVARQAAQTEAAKANAVSDFLQKSLQSANPDEHKGSDYTVRQLLDDYAASLEGQFKNQPEVEASVRQTIGRAYYRLDVFDKAQAQLERALILRRRLFGEDEQVAATLADCAWASHGQSQLAKAESEARAALDIYRKKGAVGQPVIFALWILQLTLSGEERYADVGAVTEEALAIARKTPNTEFPEIASIIHGLAQAKLQQAKYAEAENLFRQAVEMHRRLHGSQHPETGWALVGLATSLRQQHKLDEAERASREALAIFKRQWSYGGNSAVAISELKAALEAKGDFAGLAALYESILAEQRSTLGPDSPAVADTLVSLAGALQLQGKPTEAEKAAREALDITRKLAGPDLTSLPSIVGQLAQLLNARGKSDESEKLFEDNINVARKKLGETSPILGELFHTYANFVAYRESKPDLAAELYLKALPIRRANTNDGLQYTLRELGGVLLASGKPKEAEPYLREALTLYRKLHQNEEIWGSAWPAANLADALYQQHRLPEAEQAYREALIAYSKTEGIGGEGHTRTMESLLQTMKSENKLPEAESFLKEELSQEKQSLGQINLTLVPTLLDLADLLNSDNKAEEAANRYSEAEKIISDSRGEDLLKLPPIVRRLAESLRARGKSLEAEKLYENMIGLARKNGEESGSVLGDLLYDSGFFLQYREGEPIAAVERYLEALTIRHANTNDELSTTLRELGNALLSSGKPKDAEPYLREALTIFRSLHTMDDTHGTAQAMFMIAESLKAQDKQTESEHFYCDALLSYSKTEGFGGEGYAHTLQSLIQILKSEHKLSESESSLKEVLAHGRQSIGGTNLILVPTMLDLAELFKSDNKPEEAANNYREAAEIISNSCTEDFLKLPATTISKMIHQGPQPQARDLCNKLLTTPVANAEWVNDVAWALVTDDEPTPSDGALAVELAQKAVAMNNRKEPNFLDTLAAACSENGQFTNAVRIQKEAIALLQNEEQKKDFASRLKLYESNTRYCDPDPLAERASALLDEGKFAEAEPVARECLALREKMVPDDWRTFNVRSMLGGSLLGQKKYADAEPLLSSGYEGMKRREDKIPPEGRLRLQETLQRLMALYEQTSRPDRAAEWKKRAALAQEASSLRSRADSFGRAGRWKEAATDLSKLVELGGSSDYEHFQLTLLLLENGDMAGYRVQCQKITARFGDTNDPGILDKAAKVCLLVPEGVSDLTVACQLADKAITLGKDSAWVNYFRLVKGLTEYRAGHFVSAVEWTGKIPGQPTTTQDASPAWNRDVAAYSVLAMAQHQLKRANEAQAALAKGVAIEETKLPQLDSGDLGQDWPNWLVAHILLREAQMLIEDQPATVK